MKKKVYEFDWEGEGEFRRTSWPKEKPPDGGTAEFLETESTDEDDETAEFLETEFKDWIWCSCG